ncbi:uncharacterized protein EV420DRAFT_110529 [Desarmillaria tabescens]|uniref:Uncharacterized protein n=1 Tax=Armillaria tabescens TaxID=1929756 RepID=A0AA39NRJ7_ARMTA|nr:uncharacterized protein EV420DRAFT_110529 [Desarmillaria tabescens]KAK0470375.1 hypothetical protein EV420DRAFT_110529 [Desarmillaria tabescens]
MLSVLEPKLNWISSVKPCRTRGRHSSNGCDDESRGRPRQTRTILHQRRLPFINQFLPATRLVLIQSPFRQRITRPSQQSRLPSAHFRHHQRSDKQQGHCYQDEDHCWGTRRGRHRLSDCVGAEGPSYPGRPCASQVLKLEGMPPSHERGIVEYSLDNRARPRWFSINNFFTFSSFSLCLALIHWFSRYYHIPLPLRI